MIGAIDINGFIPLACEIIFKDEISEEGAAGTVNQAKFLEYVKNRIVPILGNFMRSEPCSIVVIDNASTHITEEVKDLIHGAGAYLLYTAPYSPDINPIEHAFNVYKSTLKRLHNHPGLDWYHIHLKGLQSVTRDFCINEYRRCGMPLSSSDFILNS